jgi:hypothetical protein
MGWATLWAILSQTHMVTLPTPVLEMCLNATKTIKALKFFKKSNLDR